MNYKAFSEQDKAKARADISAFFMQLCGKKGATQPEKPKPTDPPNAADIIKKFTTSSEQIPFVNGKIWK